MKEKNEIYAVIGSLLNQVLFGNINKPIFNFRKTELSNEFIDVYYQNQKSSNSDIIDNFLESKIELTLKDFNQRNRAVLAQLILKDIIFIEGMILLQIIEKKETIESIKNEIEAEIANFMFNEASNSYIIIFLKLFFEEIFYYKFSNLNWITENEYLDLYTQISNKKVIV